MQALQSQSFLSSDSAAMDQLQDFLRRRQQAAEPVDDFDQLEQELHRLFVAAEREALGRELWRFDRDVPQIEIDGERYDRVLRCETTYNSAAGPVRQDGRILHPWAPNAGAHLLPEAGATPERTLEAVKCSVGYAKICTFSYKNSGAKSAPFGHVTVWSSGLTVND